MQRDGQDISSGQIERLPHIRYFDDDASEEDYIRRPTLVVQRVCNAPNDTPNVNRRAVVNSVRCDATNINSCWQTRPVRGIPRTKCGQGPPAYATALMP